MDAFKNFAKSTLASGITSGATSLTVATGTGAKFASVPFNALIWDKTTYTYASDDPNAEWVRVTAVSTDTFTVTRGQEGTSAVAHNTGGKTYGIIAGPSAKTFNFDLLPADGKVLGATSNRQDFASGIGLNQGVGVNFNIDTDVSTLDAPIGYGLRLHDGNLGVTHGQSLANLSVDREVFWPDQDGIVVLGSTLADYIGTFRTSADVTKTNTAFASLTSLAPVFGVGQKCFGELVIKCNNSVATEGIKFDFNGGTATMADFWAAGNQVVGGTDVLGSGISTSLAGVINFSTITGETLIVIKFSFEISGAGTFVPRFAENSAAAGTATVRLGSYMIVTPLH